MRQDNGVLFPHHHGDCEHLCHTRSPSSFQMGLCASPVGEGAPRERLVAVGHTSLVDALPAYGVQRGVVLPFHAPRLWLHGHNLAPHPLLYLSVVITLS